MQAGLKVSVEGRESDDLFHLQQDEREKSLSFAQMSDIFGFRILTQEQPAVLHGARYCTSSTSRSRAVSRTTSPAQGQRLSVAAHHADGPAERATLEFQIRTEGMHRIAEQGVAAHWIYKKRKSKDGEGSTESVSARWLQSLIDIQDETATPASSWST